MPVTPSDILALSKLLLANGCSEAQLRASASRAFYAAYHTCLPIADSIPGLPGQDEGDHAYVINKLQNFDDPKDRNRMIRIRSMGKLLFDCRAMRRIADYEIGSMFTDLNTQQIIQDSEAILEKANTL